MTIFLGLGSNLGDSMGYFKQAVDALDRVGINVTRAASIYRTAPVNAPPGSPAFLNTALEAHSSASPERVMQLCLEIERAAHRERQEPNAPRTLDIDLLVAPDLTLRTPALTLPHPRYAERRFALVPLNEIAPDLIDPVRRRTIRELLATCPDESGVTLYAPPLRISRILP